MQVALGGVDIEKDEVYDQVIPVEKAITHENYNQSPFALYNDIGKAQIWPSALYIFTKNQVFYPFFPIFFAFVALLQLKVTNRPYCAKETRLVKTACLPNQPFSSGTECVISGWGATETRKHHFSHSG